MCVLKYLDLSGQTKGPSPLRLRSIFPYLLHKLKKSTHNKYQNSDRLLIVDESLDLYINQHVLTRNNNGKTEKSITFGT